MLTYNQDEERGSQWRVLLQRILGIAPLIVLTIFLFAQNSFIYRVDREYPTVFFLFGWAVGMLSYHQDVRLDFKQWAFLSQLFSVICLIEIVVFGFTRGVWINFLIAPPMIWVHIQLSRRWWARPGAWW